MSIWSENVRLEDAAFREEGGLVRVAKIAFSVLAGILVVALSPSHIDAMMCELGHMRRVFGAPAGFQARLPHQFEMGFVCF